VTVGSVRQPARVRARRPAATTRAVILAGGRGTRLAPFTSVLPKPLMPIGDRSILEIVVGQLARHGFTDITFCVGHLSHLIQAVFGDGTTRSVEIGYVHETSARGTAGPLRLIDEPVDVFLVMNGDVLTDLDYRDLVEHHRKARNLVTIATQRRTIKLEYGVLQLESQDPRASSVSGWEEKPEISAHVSMGVYVVEPAALDYIPEDTYFDFPDLVQALLRARQRVGAYLHDGLWLDIGRHEDYEQANAVWPANGNGHPAKPGA
jgi:NDP-sugar pyrophosphorylase family protein